MTITPEREAELLALNGYTPGPWRQEQRYSFIAHSDSEQVVWDVPNSCALSLVADCGGKTATDRADACLIAAAPDLHAALRAAAAERDAMRAEIERLRWAALSAIEIIADSWGEDQIEAGDDQACNVLRAALEASHDRAAQ